jgi:leucyl-tRNA synthetase
MRDANCAERAVVEEMILMVAPFAPHFAEEAWERLGHDHSIFDARWPTWDDALTVEETVELAVQVNGKTRGKVTVRRGASEEEAVAAARAEPSIARFLAGKMVGKTILVANRLLNLVLQ